MFFTKNTLLYEATLLKMLNTSVHFPKNIKFCLHQLIKHPQIVPYRWSDQNHWTMIPYWTPLKQGTESSLLDLEVSLHHVTDRVNQTLEVFSEVKNT